MQKKVSLVTPCYNGETYLSRYLDSLLRQDYPNIELILVNDGSTDSTERIYQSFLPKLQEKGIDCKYVYQENLGLAGAVNTGIKYVSGEYLAWPDSDDILLPNFISSRVSTLESHPNAGIVVCPVHIVDENDVNTVVKTTSISNLNWNENGESNIFRKILLLEDLLCFPGTFMLRFQMFKETNPKLDFIHPKEIGQDFQMLLPISYKYSACRCDDVSFKYVVRADSHSHQKKTKQQQIEKYNIGKKVLHDILHIVPFENEARRKKASDLVDMRFYRWMMTIGMQYHDDGLFLQNYKLHSKIEKPPHKFFSTYFKIKHPMCKGAFELFSFFKSVFRKK